MYSTQKYLLSINEKRKKLFESIKITSYHVIFIIDVYLIKTKYNQQLSFQKSEQAFAFDCNSALFYCRIVVIAVIDQLINQSIMQTDVYRLTPRQTYLFMVRHDIVKNIPDTYPHYYSGTFVTRKGIANSIWEFSELIEHTTDTNMHHQTVHTYIGPCQIPFFGTMYPSIDVVNDFEPEDVPSNSKDISRARVQKDATDHST